MGDGIILAALGLLFGIALGALTAYILQRNGSTGAGAYVDGYHSAIADVSALNAGTLPAGHTHTEQWLEDEWR